MPTFVIDSHGNAINAASIARGKLEYVNGHEPRVRLYDAAGECLGIFKGRPYELARLCEGPPRLLPATPGLHPLVLWRLPRWLGVARGIAGHRLAPQTRAARAPGRDPLG